MCVCVYLLRRRGGRWKKIPLDVEAAGLLIGRKRTLEQDALARRHINIFLRSLDCDQFDTTYKHTTCIWTLREQNPVAKIPYIELLPTHQPGNHREDDKEKHSPTMAIRTNKRNVEHIFTEVTSTRFLRICLITVPWLLAGRKCQSTIGMVTVVLIRQCLHIHVWQNGCVFFLFETVGFNWSGVASNKKEPKTIMPVQTFKKYSVCFALKQQRACFLPSNESF